MKNKSQVVLLALLSKCFFLLSSSSLFSECHSLSVIELAQSQEKPYQIVEKVLAFLRSGDGSSLVSSFHPRLKITQEKLDAFYQVEKSRLGYPLTPSLYRAWQISSPDEIAEKIYCQKDGVNLLTHYGYDHQLSFWITTLGKKEQGVLYISLVPKEGDYFIGSFHGVKWSHLRKTYKEWAKEAFSDKEKKLAYIKLDLAKKLTLGLPFFEIDATREIEAYQEKLFPEGGFLSALQKSLKGLSLQSVRTLFNEKSMGLVFTYLPGDLSVETVNLEQDCDKIKKSLGFLRQKLTGIRCELPASHTLSTRDPSFFLRF